MTLDDDAPIWAKTIIDGLNRPFPWGSAHQSSDQTMSTSLHGASTRPSTVAWTGTRRSTCSGRRSPCSVARIR